MFDGNDRVPVALPFAIAFIAGIVRAAFEGYLPTPPMRITIAARSSGGAYEFHA